VDGSALPAGADVTVDAELVPIAALCNGKVERRSEGDRRYILMEGLRFYVAGEPRVSDALLCLNYPNASYPTRLFFPDKLGHGLNWNSTEYILAGHWESWSWKDVPTDQPAVEILAAHLGAFRCV
jgi:hypothetical protein